MAISSIQSILAKHPLGCSNVAYQVWSGERGIHTFCFRNKLPLQKQWSRFRNAQISETANTSTPVKCWMSSVLLRIQILPGKRVPASDQKVYFTHSYRRKTKKEKKERRNQIVPKLLDAKKGERSHSTAICQRLLSWEQVRQFYHACRLLFFFNFDFCSPSLVSTAFLQDLWYKKNSTFPPTGAILSVK